MEKASTKTMRITRSSILLLLLFFSFYAQAQVNIAPNATASASTCNTGACSTLNDLNFGTCGTQQMWISTATPPSGAEWLEFTWTSPVTTNKITIHHGQTTGRFLAGGIIQSWNGSAYVNQFTFSGLSQSNCVNDVNFPPFTSTKLRITGFVPGPTGQQSNMNFREIEVWQAVLGINNAGVVSIDSPSVYCTAGLKNVFATIKNFGTNIIDTVSVGWSVNGTAQTSLTYLGILDTAGGSGSSTAQVSLGTYTFPTTPVALKVWTYNPNNSADTINNNDTAYASKAPSMGGVFTIDPAGSGTTNFTTFADAITALNANGICAPVVFNVAAGTYTVTSAITIGNIVGVNATNTITFEGTNAATRIITGSIANSAVIVMNGSKYIYWRNLTVTNTNPAPAGIAMVGAVSNIKIFKCTVNIPIQSGTSTTGYGIIATGTANGYGVSGMSGDSIVIDSNTINGGGYALVCYGVQNANANRGIQIRNNITNNTNYFGAYIAYNFNPLDIIGNTFNMQGQNYGYYGLYFYYNQSSNTTQAHQIIGNKILNFGGYGIYLYYPINNASATPVKVYNNTISSGTNSSYTGYYGIYLYQASSTYQAEIYHNTIVMNGPTTSTTYTCFYNTGSTVTLIKNNVFAVTAGTATPLYLATNPTGNVVNYNNYYKYVTPATSNLVYRGGFYNPSTYKTATAGGDSSFNVLPSFVSISPVPGNYHLTDGCNGYGFDLTAFVPTDIDGDLRAITPNPGSDEFIGGVANNLFAQTLLTPAPPIALGSQDLKFIVKNIGNNTVTSFNASYKLNAGTPVTQAWSGTMASCAQDTVIFTGANQVTMGSTNTLKVYTAAPNGNPDADKNNDTISVVLYAPLNGTYTVGGTAPDFATPNAAVAALSAFGVGGPVIFDIRPGTYTGQVDINTAIIGASATNTITFEGNNAATRIITSSTSGGVTFRIKDAKYIKVRNLTIANTYVGGTCGGFAVVGSTSSYNASNNSITKCIINLPVESGTTSYGYGIVFTGTVTGAGLASMGADSSVIDSNVINGGAYGIVHYGSSNASYNRGIQVRNNVANNINAYGGYISSNYNPVDVIGNTFNMQGQNYGYYGLYFYYNQSNNATVSHNIIGNKIQNFGGYGLYCYYPINSTAAAKVKIYNNTIVGGTGSSYPGYYGVYLYQANSAYIAEVYHNTIVMNGSGTSTSYTCFYNTGSTSTRIKNNIFAVTAGSYTPLYLGTNPTGNVVNYNNYYNYTNPATGNLLYRSGYYNPSNYLSATAGGDSSFNSRPAFVSISPVPGNYHLTDGCNGYGVDLTADVPTDIDGDTRAITPNPGSDEFAGGVADNIMALSILTPVAPITLGAQDLKFIVKNIGSNTVTSFNASYKLNTSSTVTQAWSGSMVTCSQDTVTFTGANQITMVSTNNLKVYTAAPNGNPDSDKTNDTITTVMFAPLSGTYTVGGTTPDFANLQLAAAALSYGVGGPVVFDIRPGTYTGQVIVQGPVLGTSASNTVTFEGNNASTRIVTSNMSGQATFKIVNASYIKVRNLTIENTYATGNCGAFASIGAANSYQSSNNSIIKCVINLPIETTTSFYGYGICFTSSASGTGVSTMGSDSSVIDSNVINGGAYAIVHYGTQNASYNRGLKIRNNVTNNTSYFGAYMPYSYNAIDLLNNTFNMMSQVYGYYGVYFYYNQNSSSTDSHNIKGNRVLNFGGYGIYLYYPQASSTALKTNIYNNLIVGGIGSSYLGYYGIYLYQASSAYVAEVYHNTFVMRNSAGTSTTYTGFYNTGSSSTLIKNNIFAVTAGAYTPLYCATSPIGNNVNYNLYYNATSPTATLLYRGANYTAANYLSATAGGDSSYNANPLFVDPATYNYAVTTCFVGTDLTALVPNDINNVVRNVPPKVGAYENSIPISYGSSSAVQVTGAVPPGATDAAVLRIPVVMGGCGSGLVTDMRFNTVGTTAVANIVSAKLYKTGASRVFSNTNLLGTVFAPSGQFAFSISDPINRDFGDTTNYWLAYDVSASATPTNLLDARVDSINVLGIYRIPANNNPSGNLVVTAPMTYVGSDVIHPLLTTVQPGTAQNQILRINVIGSSSGAPINATQFDFNTNGGAQDTLNLLNAKLYYTGSSSTFSAATLFGTYAPTGLSTMTWPGYSITGLQQLANNNNYFWLTYDLKSGAVLGDSVDAEMVSVVVNGTTQYPSSGAPAGSRKIRAPYCTSAATTTADGEIMNVTVGVLNNSSTCATTGGPGSLLNRYSDYTNLNPVNMVAGLPLNFSVLTATCGGNYTGVLGIWADLNDDGDFIDVGETLHMSTTFTYGAGVYRTGTLTIPCTANAGVLRMRVALIETGTSPISPCGTYGYGETEDYLINVVSGSPVHNASKVVQVTGAVIAGSTDVPIIRVPVKVQSSPCNPGIVTEVRLNTSGTSLVSNIVSAKLYKTGTSPVFSTGNLLATLFSPSGQMIFSVNDTVNNDTNNYWLAYDVSSSAANGATLDARADSIYAFGNYYIPNPNDPAGNRVVSVPMSYVSSTSFQPDLTQVEQNSVNNIILMVPVTMSATGAPVNVTNFNLSTTGSAAPSTNIASAKVWYTGASSSFAATTQFGATSTSPNGAFSVAGSQALINGVNYFWVTYNIPSSAIIGDSVDIVINGVTIDGVPQTPTVTAPVGSRKIRAPYCIPTYVDGCATVDYIDSVWVGTTLVNVSNCNGNYNHYANVVWPTFYQGGTYTIKLSYGPDGTQYSQAWIDYNNDGDFADAGENLPVQVPANAGSNGKSFITFTIPVSNQSGLLRLRIRGGDDVQPSPTQYCGASNSTWGETEDYTINVDVAPLVTYVWTGTTSTDATVATNWTPSRTAPNLNDKLVFNLGGTINVTNVPTNTVRAVELANSTVVNISGTTGNVISAKDSLILGANTRINTNSLVVAVGTGVTSSGVQTGTGKVYGNMRLWVGSTTTSVSFPLSDNAGTTRTVGLTYTTAPTTTGSITAAFVATAPGNAGLPITDAGITAKRAGINGFWTLATTTAGGVYTGTFNGTGFYGVNSYAGLLLLNRASAVSSWMFDGTHVTTTGSNAAPVLSRTGMLNYGQYGIGGDTLVNPLPVNMLFFTARNVNGDVNLNWATATETNNKGFMVERSINGVDFEDMVFVEGKGNSKSTTQYGKEDVAAFAKAGVPTLYYRLRQVDFDGALTYSSIAVVNENDILGDDIKVFPNPFETNVGVRIESTAGSATIQLMDMHGRMISEEKISTKAGTTYYEMKNMSNLAKGVYFVRVSINGAGKTIKVTKAN
ncbi:MAG: GEVED domain-containing protein [Bacteroidota bacterium]|nr:GEVED domain-containing protein [Bacteroidota bacterium]